MKIALIAHDKKKNDLVDFCHEWKSVLEKHELYATGTTGKRIIDECQIALQRLKSGPLGGDQEIGAMVANKNIDMVVFFRDPLTSQPHEPDITALLRICDVYNVPIATNSKAANLFLDKL